MESNPRTVTATKDQISNITPQSSVLKTECIGVMDVSAKALDKAITEAVVWKT